MNIPQKVLDSLQEHNEALVSIDKYDMDSHLPPVDGMIEFIQGVCNSLHPELIGLAALLKDLHALPLEKDSGFLFVTYMRLSIYLQRKVLKTFVGLDRARKTEFKLASNRYRTKKDLPKKRPSQRGPKKQQ